jgi:hypothetical protein
MPGLVVSAGPSLLAGRLVLAEFILKSRRPPTSGDHDTPGARNCGLLERWVVRGSGKKFSTPAGNFICRKWFYCLGRSGIIFGDSRIKNLQATQKIEKKGQKYI